MDGTEPQLGPALAIQQSGRGTPELKLQYFGHLMRRVDSFEKTLMLAGIGGRRIIVQ